MREEKNRIRINRVVIYPRGKKRIYCADYFHEGKHCRRSLKTSNLKIAKQRATSLDAEIAGGTHEPPIADVRIADAIELFFESLRAAGDAEGTLDTYRSALGIFRKSLEDQGIERLQRISFLAADKYRSERKATCELKTIYDNFKTIRRFLKWCVSRHLLRKNPLSDYKVKKPVQEPKGGPSLPQIVQILKAASGRAKNAFATLAYTGMRPGELRNLRPGDVDLSGNWIHIRSRKGAETKTRLSRKIPIHELLLPVLRSLRTSSRNWLFEDATPDAGGDLRLNTQNLNEEFRELLASLGIPEGRKKGGFTLRSFRNAFETITVNQRIPQLAIDTWMGHNDNKSMSAVYYRLTEHESQKFMREVRFDVEETEREGVEVA
jgi:integrase